MSAGAAGDPPENDRRAERTLARVRTSVMAASAAVFLAVGALAINQASQFVWLERRWLHKSPDGFAWMVAWSAVAGGAFFALCLAARAGRVRSFPWPALRWIPIAVVAAWIWAWFVPPPAVVYDLELALCAAATLWSVGLTAWVWRGSPEWPRALRRIELVAMELALCALALELCLRALRATSDPGLLATAGTDIDAWLRAHRQPPGSFHLGFPINSAGLVDVEPSSFDPKRPLIACLGDSFGVGVVPHCLHYTTLAENLLQAEVYNVGVVNAGPREYRRLLETDVLPLAPRLIVVTLFLGNDISDSRRRETGFVESWLDRDEVLIRVVPRRLIALGGAPGLGNATFGVSTDRAFGPVKALRLMPWLADPLREPATLTRERFLFIEHARTEILLPAWSANYADFFRCMEQLLEAAKPIPLACLLVPDEYQVEDSLWKALLVDGVPPVADRELPQKLIGAWLAERGVPFVDLLPRLRAASPLADGALHVFHRDDTHFNTRGNAIAAEGLAELVRGCGIGR